MSSLFDSRNSNSGIRFIGILALLVLVSVVVAGLFYIIKFSSGVNKPQSSTVIFSTEPTKEMLIVTDTDEVSTEDRGAINNSTRTYDPTLTKEPIATSSTSITTNLAPTALFTPTLVVTRVSSEQFDYLMFKTNSGMVMLMSGYFMYDDLEDLDDFPCFPDCDYETYQEAVQMVWEAYENNPVVDWCEWLCQGFNNGFGYYPIGDREEYTWLKADFGEPSGLLYCSQFSVPFEEFSCQVPKLGITVTPPPQP